MQAGELEQYRASYRENRRTAAAIDSAIARHFDGMHLAPAALADVLQACEPERIALVLANTMQWRNSDGRFSQASRTWAAGIRQPDGNDSGIDNSCFYACQSHSAILEGFIGQFRRSQEQ